MAIRGMIENGLTTFTFNKEEALVLISQGILTPEATADIRNELEFAKIVAENEEEVLQVLDWMQSLYIKLEYMQ